MQIIGFQLPHTLDWDKYFFLLPPLSRETGLVALFCVGPPVLPSDQVEPVLIFLLCSLVVSRVVS